MQKILLLSLFLFSSALCCTAQTTLVLKPNATIGEDATLWMLDGDCLPWSMSATPADVNYGNNIELRYQDWTWSAAGCGSGTIRSLLRFSGVAAIPSSATVISAELKLFGPSEFPYDPITNSVYPGSPFELLNNGFLQRVTGSWDESTVTWNTQPSVSTADEKNIPVSATQFSWNISIDVTDFITGYVTGAYPNYGFLLRQEVEEHYRSCLFVSSDYTVDSLLWPELVIVYKEQEPPVDTTDEPVIVPPDTVPVPGPPGNDTSGAVVPPVDTFESCNVLVPSAFSPNNDGVNDVLRPKIENGCPLRNYSFAIFNRWGQLIFSSSEPEMGWDGYFNGGICDIGTYVYEINVTTDQGQRSFKGDVTLLR